MLSFGEGWFTVAAMVVTVGRSSIGDWLPRTARESRASDAGGCSTRRTHGPGSCRRRRDRREDIATGGCAVDRCGAPSRALGNTGLHGSVALDGVSLTVSALEGDKLQVALIDYTLQHTSLGGLVEGNKVNVETDVIGKYVQRLVAPYLNR